MSKTQEALKLALEALERCVATCFEQYAHEQVMSRPEHFVNQTITAIREALAEQPAQGCNYCNHPLYAGTSCKNCGRVTEQTAQKQEPVAWRHDMGEENGGWEYFEEASCPECQPLYTSPPPRQPLTDEEIIDKTRWLCVDMRWPSSVLDIARAIEAAHGIKGEA